MKSKSLAFAALLLMACEGEPPKMPSTPAAPVAEPAVTTPVADDTATEPAAATPAPAAAGALPPCACACNCAGGAAVDGGAPAEGGAPAVVAATPAPGNITGTVTTMPKSVGTPVVFLEEAPVNPSAKMTATVTNRMMNFLPFVTVVPAGGKVVFRNEDPFPHNVFSPDNEKFNMGMIPQRAAAVRTFKSAGAYTLLCNVHPGMVGYVYSTPSTYFAKADAQGHYAIKNVPPGTYKVTAWAPRQQPITESVTVKDGDAPLNFDLHR